MPGLYHKKKRKKQGRTQDTEEKAVTSINNLIYQSYILL